MTGRSRSSPGRSCELRPGISETGAELGGALAVALLATLGTAVYRSRLDDEISARVPDDAAEAATSTLGGAVAEELPRALVLHYLADWALPLREFARILRPGGALMISTHHPTQDVMIATPPAPYFETVLLTDRADVDSRV